MKNLGLSEINEVDPIKRLSVLFKRFSEQAFDSEIYAYLSKKISEDSEILKTIPSDTTQPIPNLFLSAINYLLYKDSQAVLQRYYPNHNGQTSLSVDFYLAFKNFYFENIDGVTTIMHSRLVQTNEVRRCALLLPAVSVVAAKTTGPLALIDVGTSSGLNLLMDQYRIEYSNGCELGDPQSNLTLECEAKGPFPTHFKAAKIATRIGIDLNPLDLKKEDEKLWALSLIWPDQLSRIERLQQAIAISSRFKLDLRKGSALDLIHSVLQEVPAGQSVCVMHSFVLNQFPAELRAQFEEQLKLASKKREFWRISCEWLETEFSELVLEHFAGGEKTSRQKLADVHHHGEWINWAGV